jgi:hypothetical protein
MFFLLKESGFGKARILEMGEALLGAKESVFTSLRYLELRNWQLPDRVAFRNFFSRHSCTLKEVRVLACTIYEDSRRNLSENWLDRICF